MTSLCECGCGQEVKIGISGEQNKFIVRHNFRGKRPFKRRKPIALMTCIRCGIKKEVSPYLVETRQFCSTNCRDLFRKERLSEHHPQYKRVEHACGICGVIFLVTPARIKNNIKFCSKECANKSRSLKISKEEGNKKNNILRDRIRQRDDNKCKVCGFSHVVEVHHIIPRKEGGTHRKDNLITLCPNHHAMAHRGIIEKNELLDLIK